MMRKITKSTMELYVGSIFLFLAMFGTQGTGESTESKECRFPPSLWCSSKDIAVECGVFDQCWKNEWSRSPVWNVGQAAQPVALALYYESLCPGCKMFMNTQLWPTWKKIGSIMNITLVPYGNAQETKNGSKWDFNCQHGPEECIGNLIETCALNELGDFQKSFPFIHCIEESTKYPSQAYKQCAQKLAVPLAQIDRCMKSSRGNQFEHEMAEATNALQPPHQFVPWVTLNGVHTDDIQHKAQMNLLDLICSTYKGPAPSGCNGSATFPTCQQGNYGK